MNKILVLIDKEYISFSITNNIDTENLNNTNVINTKNLKFTEEYIVENLELVAAFFQLLLIKNRISKAKIKNIEIAETILQLLKLLSNIEQVIFTEDKELNYTLSGLLLENHNLEKIECYSMPEILFYKFPNNTVNTRGEILFSSQFMKLNNIQTYSQLCNKEKIYIDNSINSCELDELMYFFKINRKLKKIIITNYSRKKILLIINMLRDNDFKKVNIIIIETNDLLDSIMKDINLFNKIEKKYNVNIKIKYSKEYKDKNKIKQLNIAMFRGIMLILIIIGLIIFGITKFTERKTNDHFDVNVKIINDIIDEVDNNDTVDNNIVPSNDEQSDNISDNSNNQANTYVSPYYKKYEQVYDKLLAINNDTVGWLTVKNTKVNYPVVQTTDNDYYLNHAFDKRNNLAGWIFVDYRNDMDNIDKNTIVYGHNVHKNELLFGSLKKVLDSDWLNNSDNYNITFNIKGQEMTWKVFSIYTTEKTNDYLITKFNSNKSFINYVNDKINKSVYDFGVEVNDSDKILTLSTCYDNADHRLVIHAKKIS